MFLSSSYFYHPHIYKRNWKYSAASHIISKAFPQQAGWTSRSESTNNINGSLLPIQFSPNSKIKYFSFSIVRGQLSFSADFRLFNAGRSLLVPKLHTFNSNFNSNYCLYKSVESFLVEESAYISIAVTLFMIKRDVFFQLFTRCVDLGGTGLTDLLRPSIAIIVCEFAHLSLPASFG